MADQAVGGEQRNMMIHLSISQLLFYGGIAVTAGAVIAMAVCGAVFAVTGRKLKAALEEEYGKPQ